MKKRSCSRKHKVGKEYVSFEWAPLPPSVKEIAKVLSGEPETMCWQVKIIVAPKRRKVLR